jgi:hypothetical protein
MIVTPANMLVYRTVNDRGATSHESYVNAQMHFMKSKDGIPQEFAWWKHERSATISIDTVTKSYELLENILKHPSEDALDLIHLYIRSCKAYEDHDFGLCLITSWGIVEKLLDFYWEGYLDHLNSARLALPGKQKFLNKDRRKILTDGRDYSASVITEILSLNGVIPGSLYVEISQVRQARNRWIHGLESVSSDTAGAAIRLAGEMLRLIYNLDFRVPLSLYMLL